LAQYSWSGLWSDFVAVNVDQEPGEELFMYASNGRTRIHDMNPTPHRASLEQTSQVAKGGGVTPPPFLFVGKTVLALTTVGGETARRRGG